jgi:hypothetical protein
LWHWKASYPQTLSDGIHLFILLFLSGSTRVERNECNCNFASEMKTHWMGFGYHQDGQIMSQICDQLWVAVESKQNVEPDKDPDHLVSIL